MLQSIEHRVVQRRASVGNKRAQRSVEIAGVVGGNAASGERITNRVAERDDKQLVIRMAAPRKIERGGHDAADLPAHAAGVIDDQSDTDRRVLIGEEQDVLQDAVVEDSELLA